MRRPMIKPEHLPVRHGDDRVRIGGIVAGIAADIVDPDGWVWALLEALDGSRTTDQVVADLVHLHPARSRTEIRLAIDDLVRAGYVEDAAIGLYRASGYREVAPFNDEYYAHHWFEKTLPGPRTLA